MRPRAYGVHTGMRLKEAQRICPGFVQVPAHPERYAQVSTRIMEALSSITPDMEIFSVDEAFLDITHCQRLLGTPQRIARQVKQTVLEASGGGALLGGGQRRQDQRQVRRQTQQNPTA